MQDLAYAFSMLVQEELANKVKEAGYPGWTMFDMGRAESSPFASFLVRINLPDAGFESSLYCPWRVHPAGNTHAFRVDVWISEGVPNPMPNSWEAMYKDRAHVGLTVYHARTTGELEWKVEPAGWDKGSPVPRVVKPGQRVVCHRILWLIDDPTCQVGLADKLHRLMGNFLLTQQKMPDH